MQLPNLIAPFVSRLEKLAIPYMVTGSAAGIMYGEPRMTHDVDIVVALTLRDVSSFVAAFPIEDFYCPPEDVHANLIHHESGFKADIYVAFDELHRWGLGRRKQVTLDGAAIQIAPPEYVIVRKLEYFREGRSEKHLRDIRSMLEVSETIDRAVIEQFVAARGLAAEWSAATSG